MSEFTSTSIHQEVEFKTSVNRVYEVLLDEKQFSAFTAATAQIEHEADSSTSWTIRH